MNIFANWTAHQKNIATFVVALDCIWRARNKNIFENCPHNFEDICQDIKTRSNELIQSVELVGKGEYILGFARNICHHGRIFCSILRFKIPETDSMEALSIMQARCVQIIHVAWRGIMSFGK
ncbi:hypothetical protein MTR_5g082120 [Medicago truncatula]|uniref:Uncharacterized protein n=1 Tax=Medicago truncatula TaxID=3880 RepID=G7KGW6_MEDTR|nr:hypothetical protein MTR_5g082120 [Medicago truncatula]